MSSAKVLDSYALIAFLENESGAEKVGSLLKQARTSDKPLFLSVINWGEVYYVLSRAAGKLAADQALQAIDTLPIQVIPVDREMTYLAAEIKSTKKMSYADCFAAALAKVKRAELVTGDSEFKQVEDSIKIFWL